MKSNQTKLAKIKLLQDMGFEINHEDSSVSFCGFDFDFSATNGDVSSILYTTIKTVEKVAFEKGKDYIKEQFKILMLE